MQLTETRNRLKASTGSSPAESPRIMNAVTEPQRHRAEARTERQQQWLTIVQAALFMLTQSRATEMAAMNKLRCVFAPIVKRLLERRRRRQRVLLVLEAYRSNLANHQERLVAVLQRVPLFDGFSTMFLSLLSHEFVPGYASKGQYLSPVGDVAGDLFVLVAGSVELVAEHTTTQSSPVRSKATPSKRTDAKMNLVTLGEVSALGDVTGNLGTVVGELNVAMGTDPCCLGLRTASSQVVFWKLPQLSISRLISSSNEDAARLNAAFLKNQCITRANFLRLTHPPSVHALRNAGQPGSILNGWKDDEVELLLHLLSPVVARRGACLFQPGDESDCLYFVCFGAVEITVGGQQGSRGRRRKSLSRRDRTQVATVGPWTCFGADTMVALDARSSSARAATDVGLWMCRRESFLEMLRGVPRLYMLVGKNVTEQKSQRFAADANPEELCDLLKLDPLWSGLSGATLTAISLEAATPRWAPRQERLTAAAAGKNCFFVMRQGSCSVRGHQRPTATGAFDSLCRFATAPCVINAPGSVSVGATAAVDESLEVRASSSVEFWEMTVEAIAAAVTEHAGRAAWQGLQSRAGAMWDRVVLELHSQPSK